MSHIGTVLGAALFFGAWILILAVGRVEVFFGVAALLFVLLVGSSIGNHERQNNG